MTRLSYLGRCRRCHRTGHTATSATCQGPPQETARLVSPLERALRAELDRLEMAQADLLMQLNALLNLRAELEHVTYRRRVIAAALESVAAAIDALEGEEASR